MANPTRFTRRLKLLQRLEELKNDPTKTAARYDEVIKLRMHLLDILEDNRLLELVEQYPWIANIRLRIAKESKMWGRKGDCV